MAEPQLSPEELDRLEDALEGLEHGDLLDDPSPHVRARLADYRELLIASRDALPMEDVPPGLLAGVLAEARADEGEEVLGFVPADATAEPESFWSRARKSFLIPTLAVVGTAALILLIVGPINGDKADSDTQVVARAEKVPDAAKKQPAESPGPEILDPAPDAEAEDEPEPAAAGDAGDDALYEVATARKSRNQAGQDADAKPAPAPSGSAAVGSKKPEDKAETPAEDSRDANASWNAIEAGDKARSGGDCFTASNSYHRALDDGNDSVRARALVGLGLCAAEDGNTAKSTAYFKEARALDPDVASYIGTQSESRSTKPSRKVPPKKRKSKRKSAPLPNNALDQAQFKD